VATFQGKKWGKRMTKIEAEEVFCGFEAEEVIDR
jgi:hypothetical protein